MSFHLGHHLEADVNDSLGTRGGVAALLVPLVEGMEPLHVQVVTVLLNGVSVLGFAFSTRLAAVCTFRAIFR